MQSTFRKNRGAFKRFSGQVFIELCVCLLFVLVPLTMGLFQYGILIKTTLALNNLSREVGRYAAVNALDADITRALYATTNASDAALTSVLNASTTLSDNDNVISADDAIRIYAIARAAELKLPIAEADVGISTTKIDGSTPSPDAPPNRERYGDITVVISFNARTKGRVFVPRIIYPGDGNFSSRSVMPIQN